MESEKKERGKENLLVKKLIQITQKIKKKIKKCLIKTFVLNPIRVIIITKIGSRTKVNPIKGKIPFIGLKGRDAKRKSQSYKGDFGVKNTANSLS